MNFLYTVFCIKLLLVIHFMNTPKFVWPLNIYMFYSFLTILHSMMNIPIHWFSIHISHYFHKIDFWKWNFFHSFGKYSYLFFLSHTVSPVYSQNSVLNCSFIHHHTNSDYYHAVNHCSFDKKRNMLGFCLLMETWHSVPMPSHPSLTRMNPAEGNAGRPQASHFLLYCTLPSTCPSSRQRPENEQAHYLSKCPFPLPAHLTSGLNTDSLASCFSPRKSSQCQFQINLFFFFFASLSHLNSQLFTDILFVSNGFEWVLMFKTLHLAAPVCLQGGRPFTGSLGCMKTLYGQ